jgi:hypothetical protein
MFVAAFTIPTSLEHSIHESCPFHRIYSFIIQDVYCLSNSFTVLFLHLGFESVHQFVRPSFDLLFVM